MNRSLAEWNAPGQEIHSVVANPMFADAKNGDFSLPADSPAFAVRFEPFSLEDVGILSREENIPM